MVRFFGRRSTYARIVWDLRGNAGAVDTNASFIALLFSEGNQGRHDVLAIEPDGACACSGKSTQIPEFIARQRNALPIARSTRAKDDADESAVVLDFEGDHAPAARIVEAALECTPARMGANGCN
jgi:hypothetical protein